jgi:glycosyltransferase involved in cell wall biosynthesis
MTIGIRYVSYPDHSGYGLTALAYIRGLCNAGVPVWWQPLMWLGNTHAFWRPELGIEALAVAAEADRDAMLQDLPTLLRHTGAKPYDTVIVQTVPEHWPGMFEAGKRNVGYTTWETDALPPHWPPLLDRPDRILVPCTLNRRLFEAAGVAPPVRVVPHMRRHAWNPAPPADVAALRQRLGVPDDHFVFYSIGVWDPRKAHADLVACFARAFCAEDRVSLVLKTSTRVHALTQDIDRDGDIHQRVQAKLAAVAAETGRSSPHVAVIAADGVPGRTIDVLHAAGDCFVSLTHGEGWGVGAFDAATLGKPVLVTGYGGPEDFLGAGYPGLLDYTMVTVSGWRADASFRPPQRWAQVDLAQAERMLRRMVARHADFLEPAAEAAERIANRYAEPVVIRDFLAALDG